MSLERRGDKFLVFGLGALALVSAGLLAFFLFGTDRSGGGGAGVAGGGLGGGSEPRTPGAGRRDSAKASAEETEETVDPAKFAALIEELKAAILAEEVERADSIVAANPGLLEAAVPMLIGLLEDSSPSEKSKRLVVLYLKRVPTEEVRAALRRALQRETLLGVRKALLMALGELKDVPSIPIIAKLLLDPAELLEIRLLAADTLGYIGHPDATPALLQVIESLKNSMTTDADKSLVSHVLQALGMIKDRRATAPLLLLLQDPKSSPWLVWQLVRAMGGIGDPAVTQALLAIARAEAGDPTFGKSARLDAIRSLFAVAAAGDAATAKAIIDLFQEIPDETFKKEALHNLAKLADNKDVLKELNTVLDTNEDFAYKNLALLGMAHKGGAESVDKILETIRANEKFDSNDVASKLGRQYLQMTDDEQREAMKGKLVSALENENDPRVLESLVDNLGRTADPALAEAIQKRIESTDNAGLRSKGYFAIANAHPDKAVPMLEKAIMDTERDGQERADAIEAMQYWDSMAAIQALERLRDSLTSDDQQVMRIQVEGALNMVIQNYEKKKSGK